MSEEKARPRDKDLFPGPPNSNLSQHFEDVGNPMFSVMDVIEKLVEVSCSDENKDEPSEKAIFMTQEMLLNSDTATSVSVSSPHQNALFSPGSSGSLPQSQIERQLNTPLSESPGCVTSFPSVSNASSLYQQNQGFDINFFHPSSLPFRSITSESNTFSNGQFGLNATMANSMNLPPSSSIPNTCSTDNVLNLDIDSSNQFPRVTETASFSPLRSQLCSISHSILQNSPSHDIQFPSIHPTENDSEHTSLEDLNPSILSDNLFLGVPQNGTNTNVQQALPGANPLADTANPSIAFSLPSCSLQSTDFWTNQQIGNETFTSFSQHSVSSSNSGSKNLDNPSIHSEDTKNLSKTFSTVEKNQHTFIKDSSTCPVHEDLQDHTFSNIPFKHVFKSLPWNMELGHSYEDISPVSDDILQLHTQTRFNSIPSHSSTYSSSDLSGPQLQELKSDLDTASCSLSTPSSVGSSHQRRGLQHQASTSSSTSLDSYLNFQTFDPDANDNATTSKFEVLDNALFQHLRGNRTFSSESDTTHSSNLSAYLRADFNTPSADILHNGPSSTGDIPDCLLRQISGSTASFDDQSIIDRSISEPDSSTLSELNASPIDAAFHEDSQSSNTGSGRSRRLHRRDCHSSVSSSTETLKERLARKLKKSHPRHTPLSKKSKTDMTVKAQERQDVPSSSTQKPATATKRSSPVSEPHSDESDDDMGVVHKFITRERNRIAAQKCRHKHTKRVDTLTRQITHLESKQDRIKSDIEKLQIEAMNLESMLACHKPFCKRRKYDSSSKK